MQDQLYTNLKKLHDTESSLKFTELFRTVSKTSNQPFWRQTWQVLPCHIRWNGHVSILHYT